MQEDKQEVTKLPPLQNVAENLTKVSSPIKLNPQSVYFIECNQPLLCPSTYNFTPSCLNGTGSPSSTI